MDITSFFSFEKLITPTIIKAIYWIGIIVIAIAGVFSFFGSMYQSSLIGLATLVGTVLALLFWRVACEIYIVIFGMFERLGDIRDAIRTQQVQR